MIEDFISDIKNWVYQKFGTTNFICIIFGHKWSKWSQECFWYIDGPGNVTMERTCKRCDAEESE